MRLNKAAAYQRGFDAGVRDGMRRACPKPKLTMSPFAKRFQMLGALIDHHTDSIQTYTRLLDGSHEGLAHAMRLLDELLSEVGRVAENPYASRDSDGSGEADETGTGSVEDDSAVAKPIAQGLEP